MDVNILVPFAAMVAVEFLSVGLTTISKDAMSKGMSPFVFVVYSNALGTLIFFLLSIRAKRAPIRFPVLCKCFLLGLCGMTVMQTCVYTGISYSSPTLASAMANLIPAFTFLLAVVFRLEKLELRNRKSQIKIVGTLVSILGALIVTIYKGPPAGPWPIHPPTQPSSSNLLMIKSNWLLGGLFFTTACISTSMWNIFQAAVLKEYPSEMTILFLYCFFGTIQCAIVALIAERKNPSAWKQRPHIELVPIISSAIFGTVVSYGLITWCIRKKGPVFVAMFKPIGIAIAVFLGIIFLGDTLYVGSIVGSVVIVVGFYGVIWAQSKEEETYEIHDISQKTPLLESHTYTIILS
ncbi:EamA domain-containing protein [Cephalotus follicularis]|uniref:WAT1-related protein n=1 Tax=Cephalotus follicularis TaxID=3775 RepID=A0A1Q3CL87_CEPFO|nr:EamA domain-containing protein [Cephalotus follicularis]